MQINIKLVLKYCLVTLLLIVSLFTIKIIIQKKVNHLINEINTLKNEIGAINTINWSVELLKNNTDYFYGRAYSNLRKNYLDLEPVT